MSALRTAALRAQALLTNDAPAGARAYATPAAASFSTVDANGIKVAGNDEGARTSSISLIVKAGSRYEPAPGVAHVLSNSLFKVGHFPGARASLGASGSTPLGTARPLVD